MRGYHRCGAAISTAASKADDAPAQSPRTGVGPLQLRFFGRAKLLVLLLEDFNASLVGCNRPIQGYVVCFADPEPVQQHRQLASHRHDRALLAVLATVLG